MSKNKKILIIHDRFQYRGGGERLILIMANALGADIVTEYWDKKNSFSTAEAPARVITLGTPVHVRGLGYLSAQWRFFWQTKFIKDYDIIIFSGNNCLSAAWRARGKKKIMYCHHPVRFAYDLKNYYYYRYTKWQRPLFLAIVWLARTIYSWGIKKMDVVIANSENVKKRLNDLVGIKNVTVVYPPIDTEKFRWLGQNDYYLSFARLVDLKRVSDIARAFQKMSDLPSPDGYGKASKKLIIASGGPELDRIKKICYDSRNIKILGFVSDEKLAELVGNCLANIYIPKDEDFGMSPLEAASAGKPTIGVDDGGLRETIVHKQTGYLIPKNYKIDDLVAAVEWLDKNRASGMSGDCKRQAKKFSKEKFVSEVKSIVFSQFDETLFDL